MEEAKMDGASHPSDPAPLVPPGSRESSDEGDFFDSQQRQIDQDDDESKLDGDENGPENDDPARAGRNIGYRASQIADRFIQVMDSKVHIDTVAPIDSVKGAVSKFGGILDWRERRQQVQDELDKVQGEAAEYQRRSREAAAGKAEALQELGSATGEIDDLWLSVKRAQIAEAQARKDSELAKLRLRKTEKGVGERAAAKAELDGVRDSHAAALADLRSARAELEVLLKERAAAAGEADAAVARAREAVASSREAGVAVDKVTAELGALKQDLESSRAAHDAAEEKRMRLELAWEQDKVQWQTEQEQVEEEARRLRDELIAASDLEPKVAAASELLVSLRAELFARAVEGASEEETPTTASTQVMLRKTKKELEEVKASVEKAKDEAKILRVAAASLRTDLEKEKVELAALRPNEETSSASIPSLEEELRRVTSELSAAEARAKEGGEGSKTAEQLSEARREAEQAKAKARSAQEEVGRAREEARVAKAAAQAIEARLQAVMREILAANASSEMATASADALLQESKPARNAQQGQGVVEGNVALTVEEYEELSRRARETEEAAGKRVTEAVKLIKEAKDAEVRSLEKLAQLAKQTEQKRQALRAATEKAEEAEFSKLAAERELRHWRADNDSQRRVGGGDTVASPRTGLAEISVFDNGRGNPHILSPRGGYMPRADVTVGSSAAAEAEAEAEAKQRKTFFPRMVLFLARKRAQTWNGK